MKKKLSIPLCVMRRRFAPSILHAAIFFLVACLALAGSAARSRAQNDAASQPVRPEYRWSVDVPILAAGTTLLITGNLLKVNRKFVPAEGLDVSDIHWSFDRRVIGEHSTKADTYSDYFRDASVAYPMVLAMIYQPAGTRVNGTFRRSIVYGEAILITEGISWFIKKSVDRPRPFTYLPSSELPDNPAYDVTSEAAFRSMPSGHASISFCAAGFTLSDHLISRPHASWQERAAVNFLGGFLAGVTTGMRIEGGQHFPSDTIVGGLIGTTGGVAVPLFHHYIGTDGRRAAWPSARAWCQALAGEIVGIGSGFLVAETY
jgi:membrane-associated phospholipid phosphatase